MKFIHKKTCTYYYYFISLSGAVVSFPGPGDDDNRKEVVSPSTEVLDVTVKDVFSAL